MRIFYFILFLNNIQSCSFGCLKCNKDGNCVICDITNQYFFDEGQCIQSQMENCLIQNPKGTCIQCNFQYLIDFNTNKCVKQVQNDDNCLFLSDSQQCLRCKQNFVVVEGKCEAVSTKIQNCLEYINKTECLKCEQDYYLSILTKTCSQIPQQNDCQIYTEYKCLQCKKNFIINENSLNQVFQSNLNKLQKALIDTKLNKMIIDNSYQICYEKKIQNCLEYQDTKNCFSCLSGYFLENNKCILYPSASIANCQNYLTENKCKICKTNYYLTDDYNCRKIPQESKDQNINCEVFKSDIFQIQCQICKENYYINQEGICTERTQIVDNCDIYQNNSDQCQNCKENYILSTEGLKCFNKIDNCKIHTTFSKDSLPECSNCINKYYLDNNCKLGSIQNCLIYESQTKCSKCENKYYLTSQNKCSVHKEIQQCSEYSQSIKNQCLQCNQLFRSFRIKQKCKNLPSIQNCKIYNNQENDTQSTCSKCNDKYKIKDNKCVEITVSNCLQVNLETNQCNLCEQGYYLAIYENPTTNPNKCVKGYSYILDQCETINLQKKKLNDQLQCKVCKQQSYPYNISQNQSICLENQLMPNIDIKNTTSIPNCITYQSNKCIKCDKDFYLSKNQLECMNNKCQGDSDQKNVYHPFYIQNQDNIDYYLVNYCNQPNIISNNNWVLAPSVKDKSQISIKCKTNFQIINLNIGDTIDFTNFNPDTIDNQNLISNLLDVYPKVQCPEFISGLEINNQIRTQYPENIQCQYFVKQNDKYLCVSCPFGKTGSSNSNDYLDGCIDIIGCSNQRLYNMNPYWSQFMTCHQCTEASQIPVIAWQGTSKSDPNFQAFKKFTLNEENWTSPSGENPTYSQPIFCLDYSSIATIKAGLNLSVDNSKIDKVDNCAYALLNLSYSNQFDNSGATAQPINETDALICGDCKPGFKGVYINKFYVTNCEIIKNCKNNSKWFNACSDCSDGYVYLFIDGKVDYQTCVEIPKNLKNCMAYQQTINALSTVGKCRICKKGYNLNQDGYCELLTATNCSTDYFITFNDIFNNNNNLNAIFFYLYQQGLGCQKCKEDFFAYQFKDLDSKICIKTDFIKEELTFENTSTNNVKTVYVNNCLTYKNLNPNFSIDQFYECDTCNKDYIINKNGSACVQNTGKENCLQIDINSDKCVKCKDGYGLVSNETTQKCIEGKIENCIRYNTSTVEEEVQCKTCQDGFYKEENLCKKTQFTNCKYTTSKFTCNECKDGYWPIGERDQDDNIIEISYCLKQDDSLKCKEPKIILNDILTEFSCKQCQDPEGIIIEIPEDNNQQESDNILTICLAMNEIENCSVHISKSMLTFQDQIHECQQCQQDYFINQSGLYCQERTNKDINCSKYQLTSDSCLECSEGYFIEDGGNKCIKNPSGVVGCKKYIKGPVCIQCITNRFLEDNECREIIDDNKISNCLYYSSSTQCSQCQENYYLNNNLCEKSDLKNCKVLEGIDSCKVCDQGFVFEVKDSKTTCKEFTRIKCEQLDLNSPYKCMICSDDYYIDNYGDCIKVSDNDLIDNCLKYKNAVQCQQCDTQFVLTPDRKKCLDKSDFDINCNYQILLQDLQCALCPAGSNIENQQCKIQNDILNDQNCLIVDELNPKECYICKPQSYMDQNGKCLQSIIYEDSTDKKDEIEEVNKNNIQIIIASFILCVLYLQIIIKLVKILNLKLFLLLFLLLQNHHHFLLQTLKKLVKQLQYKEHTLKLS